MKEKNKPKYNMFQNSCFMISLAWKEKEKKVIFMGIISALILVLQSLIGMFISPTILSFIENSRPLKDVLFVILGFSLASLIVNAINSYIDCNELYGKVTVRLSIVNLINRKGATTSYCNLDDNEFMNLYNKASSATSANSEATEAIWKTLTSLLANVIGLIIYLILLFTLEAWMVGVILLTSIIGYLVNKKCANYYYKHKDEIAESQKAIWYINDSSDNFATAKDIRIFNMKPWLMELLKKMMSLFNNFHNKYNRSLFWGNLVNVILTFLRNGIAYAYLIYQVINKGLSASEFLLYFSAVGGFSTWIIGILNNLSTLYTQSLDISIVREFLEYPEVFKFDEGEKLVFDNNDKFELKLENVSFKYPKSDKYILKNINLTFHPHEKLAIVGLNGAGKTTIVKLLCGFYDPTEGRVLLNGKDIRDYNRRDYYKLFSAVFQDFSLLAGTINTNVSQSEDDIDYEKVKKCIREAELEEKIESLPNKYEEKLNRVVYEDGVLLSGGETQRLMLARALYKDAPILVLDEPTAALDPIAEANLYQKYNEMTLNKSSIYISHRLASTRFCNRIILIENGDIKEEGTHDELLALKGTYYELFEVQSKYYKEEVNENGQE